MAPDGHGMIIHITMLLRPAPSPSMGILFKVLEILMLQNFAGGAVQNYLR